MKVTEVSSCGNIYHKLKDGRIGIVYPKTGTVRVSIKGLTRQDLRTPYNRDNGWGGGSTLWRINKREKITTENYEYYKVTPCESVGDCFKLLLDFERKNCEL